jgi:hypothetical protein
VASRTSRLPRTRRDAQKEHPGRHLERVEQRRRAAAGELHRQAAGPRGAGDRQRGVEQPEDQHPARRSAGVPLAPQDRVGVERRAGQPPAEPPEADPPPGSVRLAGGGRPQAPGRHRGQGGREGQAEPEEPRRLPHARRAGRDRYEDEQHGAGRLHPVGERPRDGPGSAEYKPGRGEKDHDEPDRVGREHHLGQRRPPDRQGQRQGASQHGRPERDQEQVDDRGRVDPAEQRRQRQKRHAAEDRAHQRHEPRRELAQDDLGGRQVGGQHLRQRPPRPVEVERPGRRRRGGQQGQRELRGRQRVVEIPTHFRLLADRQRAPSRDRRPDHPQGRQLPGHKQRPRRVRLPAPRGGPQLEREDGAGAE